MADMYFGLTKSVFGILCSDLAWPFKAVGLSEELIPLVIGCFARGNNSFILGGKMKSNNVIFAGVAVALTAMSSSAYAQHTSQRPIQIKNESGQKAEIYWVDPSSKRMVLQNPSMANGQTLALSE